MYEKSSRVPVWDRRHQNTRMGPLGGSHFLVSQSHYLRGIDCTNTSVHLICSTERFERDWNEVLARYNVTAARASATHTHAHSRLRYIRSRLSDSNAAYVLP